MLRRNGENIKRIKAFWHFAETRDCKFSRPPRYDRFDIPAYNSLTCTLYPSFA